MKNKNDVRFSKADQAIRQSFIDLLKVKKFDRISVKMIIDKAAINRSTFYAHFLDKYDLMDQLQEELLDNLINNLPDVNWQSNKPLIEQFQDRATGIVQNINQNRELFVLMLSNNVGNSFEKTMQDKSRTVFEGIISDEYLTVPREYVVVLLTSAVSSTLITWAKNGFKESPEEFANIISHIIPNLAIQLVQNPYNTNG
ncbi:AcrR family [Fructobacillus fructosus]|uniref:TetR/AcrR family transcriptional regulator C-terminal domain-containing protein n=1 Tax=Fructobacillus fructosus TaxID=1631 RepID=UPI00021957AF|nr:TetR/AcrR family transcriptional regulator C-terminal domain-containing protein [Fructobacillus fructosus]KRN51939.1 TetR family transcriptional regulator [Fructobacillus fructosus KCTC 3544]GAP01886.1 hypothetical protein FFRU_140380 [Fructobacillus fructosus]CAK1241436.1 AcrR family [Fructobacillus fructosus]CAK1249986.1 AcrR family [Fructobacillus fructosus]